MVSKTDILDLIHQGYTVRDLYANLKSRNNNKFSLKKSKHDSLLHLYDFLLNIYPDQNFLVGSDGPFPIGVLPFSPACQLNPDGLLGEVFQKPPEKILSDPDLIQALKEKGSKIWNGHTFSLHSLKLDPDGQAGQLNGYIGSFFDMVSSAGYLEWECLAAMHSDARTITLEELPQRNKILSKFKTPGECLRSGGRVDSVIAVSTVVIYKRKKRYWILWDVLPKKKKNHMALYHAVPSLIFQPVTGTGEEGLKDEWSVRYNVYREYLEELFNYPEAHEMEGRVSPGYFYDHPNLNFLRRLIREGGAGLFGTGLVFNVLNHRPEICTLLLIQDESWFKTQIDPSGAEQKGLKPLPLHDGASDPGEDSQYITTFPLEDPRWEEMLKPWLMVPPGAGALVLGVKQAVSMLGMEEPDWLRGFTFQMS